MKKPTSLAIIFLFFVFYTHTKAQEFFDPVYFTTGLKIGEVTSSSAVIWTRLCFTNEVVPISHAQKEAPFRSPIDFDNDMEINNMEGAVPGILGFVKIKLESQDTIIETDWERVYADQDFTYKHTVLNLSANTKYSLVVYGTQEIGLSISFTNGSFTTAPENDDIVPVFFTSSTCQYFWSFDEPIRGFKIYDSMGKLQPAFHCQTGDYVYYDKPGPMAYTVELARHKWHAMNSWPSLVQFYKRVPIYAQKDDHDLLKDDATPFSSPFGELTYDDGLAIWYEQMPLDEKPYRTFRWGKDLQIWVVEGREYRSDNEAPDGQDKTIWGKEQIQWFKETLELSDATFKILVSPTPIVGPDRAKGKIDNHSNASFNYEGNWLRQYLADQKVFVINGDRHWQYVSVDPITGLWEFSQGPTSDSHAQGWDPNDLKPEHKFLRVQGGFLGTKVYRENNLPVIKFIHYDVDGIVVHEQSFH